MEEALERAHEAINGHLEALRALGEAEPDEGAVMVGEVQLAPRAG